MGKGIKLKTCLLCSDTFEGHFNSKYCRQPKLRECKWAECSNKFEFLCGIKKGTFCSERCQSFYVSNLPEVKTKKANNPNIVVAGSDKHIKILQAKYGQHVTNVSQIPEVREKRRIQMKELQSKHYFSDALESKYGKGIRNPSQIPELKERNKAIQRIAQSKPSTKIKQIKAKEPTMNHIEEYVELDFTKWALEFKDLTGFKPSPLDLQNYFNKKTPLKIPYESKEFYLLKDSAQELHFQAVLERCGFKINIDFFRRKRFLRDSEGDPAWELDFFFPKQMVGFEIQDTATHSKISEYEEGLHGITKKGPTYHSRKKYLAELFRIKLYEFWPEDFNSGIDEQILFCLNSDEIAITYSDQYSPYSYEIANYFNNEIITDENKNIPEYITNVSKRPWWKEEK